MNTVRLITDYYRGSDGILTLYVPFISLLLAVFKDIPPRPGGYFTFELIDDRGAALVTRDETRRKDCQEI